MQGNDLTLLSLLVTTGKTSIECLKNKINGKTD